MDEIKMKLTLKLNNLSVKGLSNKIIDFLSFEKVQKNQVNSRWLKKPVLQTKKNTNILCIYHSGSEESSYHKN